MTHRELSIVIPTPNRPDLLRRAVASVFAALPSDAQVVVADDASTSPTKQVLADIFAPQPGVDCAQPDQP